ncbi:MAG: translation initiation factor IF-2 [Prevotella sp.]|nr:translation initiation factor IF-2 [Prevotella sp.]MBQ6209614.1 translation initiation factor IF-2 [Prevotella sp.]
MSIRLNKAIRELNIGFQTAVEFLNKKFNLEDGSLELTSKIDDDQYGALIEAFKKDKETRNRVAQLFQRKPKEKEKEGAKDTRAESLLESKKQQRFNPLGKLDLTSFKRKSEEKAPELTEQKPVESVAPDKKEEKGETTAVMSKPQENVAVAEKAVPKEVKEYEKPQVKTEPAPVPVKEEEKPVESVVVEKPQVEVMPKEKPVQKMEEQPIKPQTPVKNEKVAEAPVNEEKVPITPVKEKVKEAKSEEPASAKQPTPQQDNQKAKTNVFQLKSEKKILENAPQLKIQGKMDLDALNQSTRPKKKTKEEKRKEREEKVQQQRGMQSETRGERKKRDRINKVKVDINAAANQPMPSNNNDNKKKDNKKKKPRGRQKPLEVNEEDVARQVKETLARLTSKTTQNKKGAKYRKEKREAVQERLNEELSAERAESKTLKLTEFVTVSELATMMNIGVTQVIGTLMSVGIMVSINQRLDAETINLVADEFGFKTEYVSAEVQEAVSEVEDDENDLIPRAPIVTVMGHVDHGKTSLLDYIRKTNVIAGEAGGITQHIGAYNVKLEDGRRITFLDTPGHEAFTAMRARGTQVTDIAIIIVAADDSVMPTTKEAIAHAQAANVPMVFAINKIDKPGANPEKIREDLAQMNLLVEDWGGKYQCQEISAKKGMGVNDLLEKVLLEAEMLDLKANPNRKGTGSVIESSLDKGRGYVSTVLVSNGTLKVGDIVLAGTSFGRIKAMFNERNQRVEKAGPAEPCLILGLNGAPTAGDTFHVLETEQEAREIANKRLQLQREQGLRTQKKFTLDDISHRIALGEFHELNIIVKGDTNGSIEALSDSFIKLSTEKVQVNVISKAVGQISENDVMLASASDAIIVGFQVRPSADARKVADREGVDINTYSIIYDAIDDIKATMVGMLDKVKKEIVTGEIEVKQVFKISKVGTVAGGLVTEGKVHNKDKARVVRDGIVIHTAPIAALKRYKDDAKEVATGLECGISLSNFNDIQEGDIIETFTEIEVQQKL